MEVLKICEIEGWLHLTLRRPEKRNALNQELIYALTQAFLKAGQDKHLYGVVLQGEGSVFCAGADLDWLISPQGEGEVLVDLFSAVAACSSPVLAFVHGRVFGGGVGLISACDFVFAEESCQFCFSEARLGLIPAVIAPFVLKKTSLSFCQHWMMTARDFSSKTALENGLVYYAGSLQECEKQKHLLMRDLSSKNKTAVQKTKELLRVLPGMSELQTKKHVIEIFNERKNNLQVQKNIKAFLNKQK